MYILRYIFFATLSNEKTRRQQLEDAVRASEWSITALVQKLNLSRKNIHNYFENRDLEDYIVKRLEHVLHFNITNDNHDNGTVGESNYTHYSTEGSAQYWKDKYLDLLEKYTLLLEERKT